MSRVASKTGRASSAVRVGPADQVVEIVGGAWPMDHRRHDLLAEDVEGISGNGGRFDVALDHLLADHRRRQEVAPILREDPGPALAPHLMAGPPDSLQAGGHRDRRLDLDDQVDGAHVDSEFERRGGHHRLEVSPLEGFLDQHPLLAGHRSVVGAADLLPGQGVDLGTNPLCQPPRIGEDDGGAVGLDQLEQTRGRWPARSMPAG